MYWYKLLDRTIISRYSDAATTLGYASFYLFTNLSNDGPNCKLEDIWDREMHSDNNCEILGCRKPLGFLQSEHEKDHKVQRHFESFSRLQVKELCV